MFLFLDRDGVINERTPGAYVTKPEELHLIHGVKEAIAFLRVHFSYVYVVTNQAGISKKLFTHMDLARVHERLHKLLPGLIDAVYYCPHKPEYQCNCRKPQTAMAWSAQFANAKVKYTESWMVGDSASDIAFGNRLGMTTVRVGTKPEDESLFVGEAKPHHRFDDLLAFSVWAATELKN
jgi:D-glycero-D-manno-heptose 1,7-bisphosphate phosphatase